MYRFYAQVAGAAIREIDYEGHAMDFPLAAVLDAITPATRAVLIANPNNPTGTGLSLPAIERILKRARKAVVFIDEAYFEFSGVTALGQIEHSRNLFVSRTFSKVYGMAAMRLGCLFSHRGQYRIPAQGAIALQREHAGRAGGAGGDSRYGLRGELMWPKCWPRANCCARAWSASQIGYVPSSANFVLIRAGRRALEIRDRLRLTVSWCATAVTKRPAACASPWVRASKRAGYSRRWRRYGSPVNRFRHGRRAGGCD